MAEEKTHFNDGAAYERFMGRWTREAGALFLDWLAPPRGARWIDIGCGTGIFTELVLERCAPAHVAGVDPAEPQIELARGKALERVDLRVADGQMLPFEDGAFDVVASALVINFIPDRPKALAEMRRVGRPGGLVAGYVWDFAAERSVISPMRLEMARLGMAIGSVPGAEDSRLERLRSLFEDAGLRNIAAAPIDVTVSFPSFEAFWHATTPPFGTTAKTIAALSQADRETLIAAVRARLPAGSDGSIRYSARANAIKAHVPRAGS